MIVFNAATVLPRGMMKACIMAMYPLVDEFIIVEGATEKLQAKSKFDGDARRWTTTGRSTDDTVAELFQLPDPSNKLKIFHSHGWWDGKTAMCNKSAEAATGDYIWHVDSDEFYHERDVPKILDILQRWKPDAMHFYANHFWGGFTDCIDETTGAAWGNDIPWQRIFRHQKGGHWITHEPPDYQLPDGTICNKAKLIPRDMTLTAGIKLFHYGYVWRKQAEFKQYFFKNPAYLPLWDKWQMNKKTPLIRGATTVPFAGQHPAAIRELLKRK